eukprot:gnl/MRDRNA2_/MRDRNA2_110666_c0_seq1.p1 gnl/MRDRNA2_/MRDRNA2_110666_c0~~gnl/MRDRNA2_/MRDRNA2_110666_c0_seq1.p1  ORF type:complete len:813 (+),score=232.60 gnl/MRDRNA2_/MRDRNA2_110666_c0_seq1:71-2440(+)
MPDEYSARRVQDGWEEAASRRTKETTINLQKLSSRRRAMVKRHRPRPPVKNQPACAFARTAKGGIVAEELFLRDDELKMREAKNIKSQEMAQQRRQLIQDLGAASRECAQEYRITREHIRDERKRYAYSNGATIQSFVEGAADGKSKGSDELLRSDRESIMMHGDAADGLASELSPGKKAARRKSSTMVMEDCDNMESPDPSATKLRRLKFSIFHRMQADTSEDEVEATGAGNASGFETGRKTIMPKLQSSRDSRLRMLSLLGNESRKQDAAKRSKDQKRAMFEALPESEKDSFTRAFEQGKAEDDMEQSLEVLGLQGRSELEKDGIRQLCEDGDGEIDLYDFCFDLVPRTRSFLREMQRPRLLELFQKFDADKSGFLDGSECTEIVERFCSGGLDPEGIGQLKQAFQILLKDAMETMTKKKLLQKQTEVPNQAETETAAEAAEAAEAKEKKERTLEKATGFLKQMIRDKLASLEGDASPVAQTHGDFNEDDEIDFETFEELIANVQEAKEYIQRSREQKIVQETALSPELFKAHKDELILMWEAFKCADHNDNGTLEWNEVAGILIDCGLLPKDQMEQRKIEAILNVHDSNGNGAIDFGEFLEMMQDVRKAWRQRLAPELEQVFNKYDKDHGGSLSFSEVATMIGEMGLNPRSREDQDEIKQLLDNVDADGSGELDSDEFQDLVQRIEEKLKSLQRRRDLKAGEALGFNARQVCELRGIFFKLDVNGDDSISSGEIQKLAMLMRKRIRTDRLMEIFREVDGEDGNGSLDFGEFMTIVQRLDLLKPDST